MSFYRRRYRASSSAPREYADKLADAMGAGCDSRSARSYARGAAPLREFLLPLDDLDDRREVKEGSHS